MALADLILAGLLSLPTYGEDRAPGLVEAKRAQYAALAAGIATAAKAQSVTTPRDWAALVIAIGHAESGFSLRIQAGQCKPHECDRGRARGPWQLHRYAEATTWWEQMHGVEHAARQAQVASARLARGFYTCRGSADWLTATINGFAGRKCSSVWPGLEARVVLYRTALKGMARAEAKAS